MYQNNSHFFFDLAALLPGSRVPGWALELAGMVFIASG